MLATDRIRVNAVAPGPVWTPLIPATLPDTVEFGKQAPLGRPGQPAEMAPAYVFLASEHASFITGGDRQRHRRHPARRIRSGTRFVGESKKCMTGPMGKAAAFPFKLNTGGRYQESGLHVRSLVRDSFVDSAFPDGDA